MLLFILFYFVIRDAFMHLYLEKGLASWIVLYLISLLSLAAHPAAYFASEEPKLIFFVSYGCISTWCAILASLVLLSLPHKP